jgi:hypothetical protein
MCKVIDEVGDSSFATRVKMIGDNFRLLDDVTVRIVQDGYYAQQVRGIVYAYVCVMRYDSIKTDGNYVLSELLFVCNSVLRYAGQNRQKLEEILIQDVCKMVFRDD